VWCKGEPYRALVACATVALMAWAAWDLAARLAYEARGPITADTPIYAAVGRGILNHVPLYSGLFETKPPLIFLLFALSFKTVGSWALATWVQVAAIAAVSVTPLLLVLRERRDVNDLAAKAALAVLGGVSLALYTAVRSGEIQVESFGAAVLVPWIWVCSRRPDLSPPLTRARFLAGSASVAAACMTKEPFLLSAIAVGLVNTRSLRDLAEISGMLGLAGLLDVAALLVTGALGGYVQVYLHEMFGHAAFSNAPIHTGSLLERALEWGRPWDDLWSYAPGLCIALAGAGFSAVVAEQAERRSALSITIRWAAALSLCSFAIGLSGRYYNHQYVPAVPFAMAVLVTWLLPDGTAPGAAVAFGSAAAVLGLVAATASHDRPDLDSQLARLKSRESAAKTAAQQIDRALDCVGEERYAFIGTNGIQPWGWTVHSPIGPFFFQYDSWFMPSQEPHRAALLDELKKTRLLVFRELAAGDFNDPLRKAIDARFHPGLPSRCADIALAEPWSFRWAED